MAVHKDWPNSDRYWAISRQNMRRFLIGCSLLKGHTVNNYMYKCIIRSYQNSCIKYSTQNQHFAKMLTYSDNTNYSLNSYAFIVLIYLRYHLFLCLKSADPDDRFTCWRSQRLLSTKHPYLHHLEQWLIRVVFVGTRNHCEGSAYYSMLRHY
jgi:hypothetical protein